MSLVSTMSVNWFNSFLTAIMKEYVSHVTHRLVNNFKEVISGYMERTLQILMFFGDRGKSVVACASTQQVVR